MVKKIASVAAGASLLLASISPAFAQNQCGNQITGPYSENRCRQLMLKAFRLKMANIGAVNHTVNTTSNTGNNTANLNTGGGSGGVVQAGDASADVASLAGLNTVNGTVNQTSSDSDDQGLNDTTGPYSKNIVTFARVRAVAVGILNFGMVKHDVDTDVNTGNNTANLNTLGGSVTTGNATANVTVVSDVNNTQLDISQ